MRKFYNILFIACILTFAGCASTSPAPAPPPPLPQAPPPPIYIPPPPPPQYGTEFSGYFKGDYPADPAENVIILGDPYPDPDLLERRLGACQAVGQFNNDGFACVSLLYGTNRKDRTTLDRFYGNAPRPIGSETILGEVVVSIPAEYQLGEDISGASGPVSNTDIRTRNEFFAIWGGEYGPIELSKQQFLDLTRNRLDRIHANEKTAFVFVHGFNVSFRLAAYTTAQLKSDLNIKGPAFFYSWPSNASMKQYIHDQDDADISADNLADFLLTVREAVGEETKLSIIAHSMGNRVLGQAFAKIKSQNLRTDPLFDVGVFASADLDESLFRKWIIGAGNDAFSPNRLINQGFVYVTDDDSALGLSEQLRQNNCEDKDIKYRVGLVTKRDCDGNRRTPVFEGPFKTIDLSQEPGEKAFRIFDINHNKYTKSPKVICHLRKLTRANGVDINALPPFFSEVNRNSSTFWVSQSNIPVNWNEDCGHNSADDDNLLISSLLPQRIAPTYNPD